MKIYDIYYVFLFEKSVFNGFYFHKTFFYQRFSNVQVN